MSYIIGYFRIGRTGRIGQVGHDFRAVSFFSKITNAKFASTLVRYLMDSNAVVPEDLRIIAEKETTKHEERVRKSRNISNMAISRFHKKTNR